MSVGFLPSHLDSEPEVAITSPPDLSEPPDAPSPDIPPADDTLFHEERQFQPVEERQFRPVEETRVKPRQKNVERALLTSQKARQKWLDSDRETMESVRAASLPRPAKKHVPQTR